MTIISRFDATVICFRERLRHLGYTHNMGILRDFNSPHFMKVNDSEIDLYSVTRHQVVKQLLCQMPLRVFTLKRMQICSQELLSQDRISQQDFGKSKIITPSSYDICFHIQSLCLSRRDYLKHPRDLR